MARNSRPTTYSHGVGRSVWSGITCAGQADAERAIAARSEFILSGYALQITRSGGLGDVKLESYAGVEPDYAGLYRNASERANAGPHIRERSTPAEGALVE